MNTDYINLIVEISVTVYVFLLGLPILVNQILLPEDLRRMSKKNYTTTENWKLASLTSLLVFIVAIALYANNLTPENLPQSRFGATLHRLLTYRNYPVTLLFFGMLFLTLLFLFDNLIKSQGYRGRMAAFIKKKIIRHYHRTGQIEPAYLSDLEYMGIYSKSGVETRNIIDVLEDLLLHMNKKQKVVFDSHGLIVVMDTLCLSVANSIEPGSRRNMIDVLNIYKNILMELEYHSDAEHQLIQGNATRKIKDCVTKIAKYALRRDYADMMPLVLNVLTLIPRSSDKLFDIGLMALEKEQYAIATNVLSEMMDRDNEDYLTMNNYLGLIAHFYFAGDSARQCARNSLRSNGIALQEEALMEAQKYHYTMSNFPTADQIRQLRRRLFTNEDGKD